MDNTYHTVIEPIELDIEKPIAGKYKLTFNGAVEAEWDGSKPVTVTIPEGGAGGANAREIELQKSDAAIQWRYTGDEAWMDLVSLEDIKGNPGPAGEKGDPGPEGKQGIQGPVGPKGDTGATGADGKDGAPGAKGDKGEPGTDGKSAYQYAQDGGYTGTEEEFAAKLGRDYIPEYSGKTYELIDLSDETIFTTNGYYVLSGYFTVGDSEQVQIITPDVFCYSNYPDPGDKAHIILNGIYTQYEIVCKNGSTALQITKTDKSVTSVNGHTGDVTLNLATPRVRMTSANTLAVLQPNILYWFPKMESISLELADQTDDTIVAEYHCIFTSGDTPTTLILSESIMVPDGFTIEANRIYELSILEGCLSYMSWEV